MEGDRDWRLGLRLSAAAWRVHMHLQKLRMSRCADVRVVAEATRAMVPTYKVPPRRAARDVVVSFAQRYASGNLSTWLHKSTGEVEEAEM